MLSRLRSLLRRESGDHGETRVRKKENDHRSTRKTWRNKWSWGRGGEFREGKGELSGCDGLQLSRARTQEGAYPASLSAEIACPDKQFLMVSVNCQTCSCFSGRFLISFIVEKEGQQEQRSECLSQGRVSLHFINVESLSFHGNLVLIRREENSPGHVQSLRYSDAWVLNTCGQDMVLPSSRDKRSYLPHVSSEVTLSTRLR